MVICILFIAIAVVRAGFGQGTGPVLLNGVSCYGTESSLLSCRRTGIPTCSHYYDAGVVCSSCKLCTFVKSLLTSELLSLIPRPPPFFALQFV